MKIISVLIASFFLLPLRGFSSSFTLGSEVRLRYEFQNAFNQKFYGNHPKMGKGNDGFLLGRFRFGFDWRPNTTFHLKLYFQDAECWDMALPEDAFYNEKLKSQNNPNKDRWELSDSFVELNMPLDFPFRLKIGRQRLAYGDKRIFGPGTWGNSGRWIWDAIKFSYIKDSSFLDLYIGKTIIHEPRRFSLKHRHFFTSVGFYAHIPYKKAAFEPFFMTKKDKHNRYKSENGRLGDLDSYYVGSRFYIKGIKGFDVDFTYIRQFGDWGDDNIDAYGYHILLGKMFYLPLSPRVSLEFSYASGDDNPKDGEHGTFDGAFGARDKMYGRMNLFHWKNIKDYQANLELYPKKGVYIKAEFHQFYLAEKKDAWYLNPKLYRDRTGSSGSHIGSEFDIVARYRKKSIGEIQLGYGHFSPGAFCKRIASKGEANWFFLQWRRSFRKILLRR